MGLLQKHKDFFKPRQIHCRSHLNGLEYAVFSFFHHGDLSYVKAFGEYSADTRGDDRVADLYIFFSQGEFQGAGSSTRSPSLPPWPWSAG